MLSQPLFGLTEKLAVGIGNIVTTTLSVSVQADPPPGTNAMIDTVYVPELA